MKNRHLMDYWKRDAVAEAVQLIIEGRSYKDAHSIVAVKWKAKKVSRSAFHAYIRPFLKEARDARARVIEAGLLGGTTPTTVEILPPRKTLQQERNEAFMLSIIRKDTLIAVPFISESFSGLYNTALNVLSNAQSVGGIDEQLKAIEVVRRVLDDLAAMKGIKRLSDPTIVNIILATPIDQLPANLRDELGARIRQEALNRLAEDLQGVLCQDCQDTLHRLHSSSPG